MSLYRARLSLLACVGLASALLVFELPVSELLHQRSELASTTSALGTVESRNASLARDIASLRSSSTVAAMAHADYGLVLAGQQAYALLPTSTRASGAIATALENHRVPSADLVAPSADELGAGSSASASTSADGASVSGSVWNRALDRLEFWRWAF